MTIAKKRRVGAVLCCCAASGLGGASAAKAGTLFDSGGFETANGYPAQTYLYNEPLPATTGGPGIGQWTGTSYTGPYAAVYTYTSIFGGNSNLSNLNVVDINDSATTTTAYYYPLLNTITPGTGGQPSQISVAFQMARGNANTGDPFFGVIGLDGGLNQVGELGIDGTTGLLVGATTETAAGATFVALPDTFYDFDLLLDYSSQTYSLYESSTSASSYTLLGSSNFITANDSTFNTAALVSAPLLGVPVTGDGYFDNFSISSVPEPTTGALVMGGIGLATVCRRRRSGTRISIQ